MKTVKEFIQPHGSRISLQIGQWSNARLFVAERLVNGVRQQGWYGWPRKVAEERLVSWAAYEERIGSQLTTDKWERGHCPLCQARA